MLYSSFSLAYLDRISQEIYKRRIKRYNLNSINFTKQKYKNMHYEIEFSLFSKFKHEVMKVLHGKFYPKLKLDSLFFEEKEITYTLNNGIAFIG